MPPEPIYLPRPHPASLDEAELLADCDLSKGRSSGPGGQHRNKVESLVRLHHTPSGVDAHAGERRSASENRSVAIFRLRLALAVLVRTHVPIGDIRSDLWKSRCTREGKLPVNPEHKDYPAMLAEALDVVWSTGLDPKKAALRLTCSMSQLVKLIKDHPPALVALNEARAEAGEHALR
jgi:hypothetical protein